MEYVELGKILIYEQPTKYIVKDDKYSDKYKTPVLTAGKTFILGYTNETDNIFSKEKLPVIIFDDFTTATKFVDFPFKVKSSAMKILNPISGINIKYVFYAMQKIEVDSDLHKRYWISKYSNIKIPLPNIEKQNDIVNKLDKVQEIRDVRKKQIEELDELIKAQFAEMFKGCERKKLCNIADIIMGQSPNSDSYNDNEDGIPFFQGKADYGDKYTIVRHWTNKPSKTAQKGDVLMSVRAPVGPVNISSCNCCIGRGLCSISAKERLTNNEFLYHALNTLQDEIASMGSGSTFKAITKNDVYNIELPVGTIELQNQFAEFVKQIDKQKFELQKSLKEIEKLQESLMNKYFS